MSFPLPRFEAVSRRQFLQGTAVVGAVALIPTACSNNDKSVFGSDTTTLPAATSAPTTDGGSPATTDSDAATTTPAAQVSAADAFPAGAELQVSFTYSAAGDRVRNPYVAVWVETPAGDMVQTISLWLLTNKTRYLDHLTRWYNAESTLLDAGGTNNLDARAGATRGAGDYQVVWDGTDVDGRPVAKGDYVLCIEAAREHGPYELITGPITIGDSAFTTKLDDSGELSNASAAFVV